MAIRPLKNAEGKTVEMACANSLTVTKGNMMVDDGSGNLTNASAGGGADVEYIAMETVTTTSAGQLVLCLRVDPSILFSADCDAAWSTTDVGTYCDIAAAGTLDPDASSDDIFYIERGVGVAETGTVVEGHFTKGTPNS